MMKTLKNLFSKKQKEDTFVERGLEALEILKLDTRIRPMKDPSVEVEVKDLTTINNKLDSLSSDVRYISRKLITLEILLEKLEKQFATTKND